MSTSFLLGLLAALFATLSWALNFISPYVVGPYSNYDFIVARFVIAGAVGAVFIFKYRQGLRGVSVVKMFFAMSMGVLGYLLYIVSVVGGAYFSGPVLAPAVIGTVPIFMVVLGNLSQNTLLWRKLAFPLVVTMVGLVFINIELFFGEDVDFNKSQAIGFLFCITGVACWLSFSFLNQRFTDRNPSLNMGAYTGLMMLGAGLVALIFIPVGMHFGLINLVPPGVDFSSLTWFLVWAIILALLSSVGGAWAWNYATQRLPMILTGQLIAVETLFATVFGLAANQRLPTWFELMGTILVVLGVITTVRAVLKPAKSSQVTQ
ncbi:DMT family transporter [Chromohalobacter nigrandesensis]|uniref:DMT family transporter n=1 Tax=Chromohalobacter nigrandesensis TaxID=119863 RepID=UPI001FF2C819|nr:DMT family transporter [Chromohalobacter nigrandesensis]MCK0744665.1 DMT family transporter [Chromohalobacter nigrandesensis]